MKSVFPLLLSLLIAGCTSSIEMVVRDGNCIPIQDARIYHLLEGKLLYKPCGPFYTNSKGLIVLPSNAVDVTIIKEGHKPAMIETIPLNNVEVVLYAEFEAYESGLIDSNNCKDSQ